MKDCFVDREFKESSFVVIKQANEIIAEYMAQGFTLTLRQLYYQFVRRLYLENRQTEYKRLGSIVNDARLAGLIDWSAIEDRTRNLSSPPAWDDPESIVAAIADQYQEDLWKDQPYRPEVWIEKEALIGVIEGVCSELRIPHFACRGYTSQSEAYSAGRRLRSYQRGGQQPIVFHLGDHDPSGIDMTRDNDARLSMFARTPVEVRRLALNMAQIDEYNPPPNPAKETDARFTGYQEKYGDESWELDALEPSVIADLIRDAVGTIIDQDAWDNSVRDEVSNKERIQMISDRWDDVTSFLEGE